MIHQPLGGAQGQASDIEITAREIQKLKKSRFWIQIKTKKESANEFNAEVGEFSILQ